MAGRAAGQLIQRSNGVTTYSTDHYGCVRTNNPAGHLLEPASRPILRLALSQRPQDLCFEQSFLLISLSAVQGCEISTPIICASNVVPTTRRGLRQGEITVPTTHFSHFPLASVRRCCAQRTQPKLAKAFMWAPMSRLRRLQPNVLSTHLQLRHLYLP